MPVDPDKSESREIEFDSFANNEESRIVDAAFFRTVEIEGFSNGEAVDVDHIVTDNRPANKQLWLWIAIGAACAAVIALFIILRMGGGGEPEQTVENAPPPGRSVIQDEISALDWVEPAFLPINDFSRPGTLVSEISGIVIHNIGNPDTTAQQNRNYFANLALTEERYASSTFIVGLDGEILQCVPVDEVAFASNDRNMDTLSIEMCHPDDDGQFNDETYESAVHLAAWLCDRYGLDPGDDIIRHYDVSGKECPRYFVQNESAWERFRDDVGLAMGQ